MAARIAITMLQSLLTQSPGAFIDRVHIDRPEVDCSRRHRIEERISEGGPTRIRRDERSLTNISKQQARKGHDEPRELNSALAEGA